MAVFSMPFTFTTIMYGHWIFGKVMCPATLFILQFCEEYGETLKLVEQQNKFYMYRAPKLPRTKLILEISNDKLYVLVNVMTLYVSPSHLAFAKRPVIENLTVERGIISSVLNIEWGDLKYKLHGVERAIPLPKAVKIPKWKDSKCMAVEEVSVCVSIYTLTSIGIDRYYAVVHPLKLRPSKYRNRIVILIIWVISVLSGIVQLVMGGTKRYFWDGQFFYTCSEGWPTETSSVVYETFVMCMTYFVPLLVLSFTYIKVGCRLWGRQLPGNANQARDRSHMRSTRKVIKMLVVVLLMFALCWIPLHIFNIIQRVHRDLKQHEIIRAVNAILLWIAMSNSFVNPIIYSFMNDSFRKELYFLLCFCCRWRGRKRNISSSRARKFRLQQRSQRNAYSTVTVSSKLTQSGPISKRERASITTGEQNERENIEDWLVMKTNNLIITTN
uniref:Tachykinin-like peptides receptor 86C-like n=1 Tax=Saccoglossus kowalevskii TaxID=10224 RepID=A0ABM0M210_SACKO|nr:PREDICTED: tachykinin-like peptides receptor 86C-like [Saccoglossus kowalevskii]